MAEHWNRLESILETLPPNERAQVKPMVGLYMFDYLGGDSEMPPHLMELQLSTALDLLHSGTRCPL